MIKNTLITAAISVICISNSFADIAINPINAKGIVASGKTSIKMMSERVTVDLYKDSSVVECSFYMKNEGNRQHVEIGFPEMNFHHFKATKVTDFDKNFVVHDNGKQIQSINLYLPDANLLAKQKTSVNRNMLAYDEQPWYLWGSEFESGETKLITVRYSLPFGQIKRGSRYFTYLLNTGAGWRGSIDTAEVVVNIKDFSPDLILKATPANYIIKDNQIKWVFTNLEPTTNDDIKIFYEPYRGYMEKIRKPWPQPTIVLNDEIVPSQNLMQDNFQKDEILKLNVLKDSAELKKYNAGDDGVVLIYTKDYAINRLEKLMATKSTRKHLIEYKSSEDFLEKYKLIMEQITYEGDDLLLKVLDLKDDQISIVEIKKDTNGGKNIYLR